MKKTQQLRTASSPKLVLARETIRALDRDQLEAIAGGRRDCPTNSGGNVTKPTSDGNC